MKLTILIFIPIICGALAWAQSPAEKQLFDLVNHEREQRGLGRLDWNDQLAAAALKHSRLLEEHLELSHQFAGEPELQERVGATGALFNSVAENVAEAPEVTVAHEGLMHSPNQAEYWGNSYSYDAWGNLLGKSITKCGAENLGVTADTHNWIHATGPPDYRYDAAGNMIFNVTPPTQSYTWDAENRLTGAAGYAYTYDGDGNRVSKSNGNTASSGTLYWYMTPGIVAESDLAGTLKSEYVFFDGERVARKDFPSNSVAYYFSDHLKTASVITDASGKITAESDYYPWGGELPLVANDSNHFKYTGKEHDSETGNDYYGARYYSNGLGRWVSADWSSTPVPVPYADLSDPQSINLYGYVRGLPTTRNDADGHCCDWQYAVDFTGGAFRGVVSSASFGAVGAPKAEDSEGSLLGQTYGTLIEALTGVAIMSKGGGDFVIGLAAAPETGGASLLVSAGGALEVGAGGVMQAGAAKNTTAIAMVAKAGNVGSGMKPGSSGGPGSGKKATPEQRRETLQENSGMCVVPGCKNKAEHTDHADPRSKGGDTTKENLQGMCAHHNCQKGAKTSAEYEQWRKDHPDKK